METEASGGRMNQDRRIMPLGKAALGLGAFVLFSVPLSFILARSPEPPPVPAVRARIVIDAGKVEGRISPRLYGQFVEFMFEDVKGGLHAELVRNRSFEEPANAIGLSRFWEREPDDRNHDPFVKFRWDDSVSYPPAKNFEKQTIDHSLGLTLTQVDGLRRGINQGRIPVRAGVEYHGYFWLKAPDFEGRVRAALEKDQTGGETYDAQELKVAAGDWKKYEFTLKPLKSDPLAKLAILFAGRGRVWIDQVSLLPCDAVDGVRADVFEKIQALRPAFIRWPGGNVAQDYHWMWGVGPRDERTTWINLAWWNEPEPSDFGTDEYLKFCRNLGTEPTLVVNVEGRGATREEAAAWVEYVNGPATSTQGSRRAANGHPEPYGVKIWELGNEIYGHWVRGHSDAETYARNYNRYYAAMKAVDPSLKFIACGDNDLNWNRTLLQIAGPHIDYLAIHHYYGLREMRGDPLNLMAHPLFYERFYQQMQQLMKEIVPGREIKLVINEWNTSLPVPRQHSMESALYGARLMNVFERSGEVVEMTSVSDLVNGWPGGVIQASRHGLFVTPTYHVNRLYGQRLGAERLATKVESPTFDTSLEGKGITFLDAVASRSADGKQIFLKAVNTDPQRGLATEVSISGASVEPTAQVETLTADALEAANTFSQPDAVRVRQSQLQAGASFMVELPKHSVSVITLDVKR